MKVLHITKTYLSLSETFIANTLKILHSEENSNYLLTANRETPYSADLSAALYIRDWFDWTGLQKFSLGRRVLNRLDSFFVWLAKGRIKKFVATYKPDLIHFHFGWSFQVFGKTLTDLGLPMVVSFHGRDVTVYPREYPGYKDDIIKLSRMNSVQFSACSNYLREELIKLGVSPEKITVLYNTFDLAVFPIQAKKTTNENRKKLKILNVARMIEWKGQKYLLEAFSQFLSSGRKGELLLVGAGETLEDLRSLAIQLQISEHVQFLGGRSHKEVAEIMRDCDVYVQPSMHDPVTKQCETFGVVLLEAIASGLPIIATSTGGMPEVVTDGSSQGQFYFLVKDRNADEIAKVLCHLGSDSYQFRSNSEYAQERLSFFSNKNYYERLSSIYKMVLATKPSY